jgi:hypothetical protein
MPGIVLYLFWHMEPDNNIVIISFADSELLTKLKLIIQHDWLNSFKTLVNENKPVFLPATKYD